MKVQKTHSDKWYNRNSEISRPPRAVKRELKGREYSHSKLKKQANNYNGYYRYIKRKVIVSQGEKDSNRIMTPPMKTYPLAVGGIAMNPTNITSYTQRHERGVLPQS